MNANTVEPYYKLMALGLSLLVFCILLANIVTIFLPCEKKGEINNVEFPEGKLASSWRTIQFILVCTATCSRAKLNKQQIINGFHLSSLESTHWCGNKITAPAALCAIEGPAI